MSMQAGTFKPAFTVFMLVKAAPDWLSFTVAHRRQLTQAQLTPILEKHHLHASLHFLDLELYSTRVTDIWIWRTRDVPGYQHLMQDLRKSPFWNRFFNVVEILAGVDEARGRQYYRELVPTWGDPSCVGAKLAPLMQNVA